MRKIFLALALILAVGQFVSRETIATVNEVTARNNYTGNGTTTVFAYGFRITDQAHLEVLVDGVAKTLTTHYTVSGVGDSGGGNVTFIIAPANTLKVTILRKQALAQSSDYILNEAFPSERVEKDLDKLAMIAQQHEEVLARTPKLAKKQTETNITLPAPAASQYIRWNAAATDLESVTVVGTSPAAAIDRVQDEGSNLTQRATVNFIGTNISCVDNAGSVRTDCTVNHPTLKTVLTARDLAAGSTVTINSLTVREASWFTVPAALTLNQIAYNIAAVTTAGTAKVCIYSEDGATKLVDVTTGAQGAAVNTVAVGAVILNPGSYYIAIGCATTCNNTHSSGANTHALFGASTPSGKKAVRGTVTHASGVCDGTLGTVTASTSGQIAFRLDN